MSELSERNRIASQEADQRYYDRLLSADNTLRDDTLIYDARQSITRRARYRAAISFLKFAACVSVGILVVMGICLFGLGIGRLR